MPRTLDEIAGNPSIELSGNGLGTIDTGALNLGSPNKPLPEGAPGGSSEMPEDPGPATPESAVNPETETPLDRMTLSPRELWEMELAESRIEPREAASVLDSIMSTGKYEETYRAGGVQFKLRTRTTTDADRTIEILQELKPEVNGVYSHIVSRINLAASLASYGNRSFPHSPPSEDNREILDAEWRARYKFCSALPAPTFYLLTQVLQRFETKVALSSDPRSLENF